MADSVRTRPDVGVVVIAYNDAARLPTAVASVLSQTLRNLEVVIVDDASTDDTWAIAQRLARSDRRVRAVRLEANSGSGSRPRNVGLGHLTARWVMFLDSDDTYERHACKNLLLAAEAADADVAMGRSRRYIYRDGKPLRTENWYGRLYEDEAVLAGIDDCPDLIYDTLCTNKLYRRAFLERTGIRFVDGLLYQDMLFTLQVYCAARRIAVVPMLVHCWNAEENSDRPSVTRQRHDIRNFEHRLAILRRIDEFLAEQGRGDLKLAKDVKFVKHDLALYLKDLPLRDAEFRAQFMALAGEYLAGVADEAVDSCERVLRIACHHVRRGDLGQVLKAMDYLHGQEKLSADLVQRDGRIYWCDFDPRDTRARDVLDVTEMNWHLQPFHERRLYHEVTALGTHGTVLRMEITLTNGIHGLAAGRTGIEVAFRCGTGPRLNAVKAKVVFFDAARVRYLVEADLDRLPITRPSQSVWRVTARTTVGDAVNVAPLTVLHPGLPRVDGRAVQIRPARRVLVGDRLVCTTTEYGNLLLRLENSHRAGAQAVRLIRESPTAAPIRLARGGARAARAKLRSWELKTATFPLMQRLPVKRGSVVFEAYAGLRYADSPKYIYEELVRSGLPVSPVWAYRGSRDPFPAQAKLVRRGSWAYFHELARAEFWVDNEGYPGALGKRRGTTYVQTWYGTPLKRTGWDDPAVAILPAAQRRALRAKVARWDVLTVPSEYFADTVVTATGYGGRLLRCGSPRNDVLVAGIDAEEAAERKRRLGVPPDRRIVLYAPTARWRSQTPPKGSAPALKLGLLAEEVGEDFFVLLRSHHRDPLAVPARLTHFVKSVDGHHDVNDLLLVADVLVTDFSSVMFDYANLGRPMIFFADDYEKYVLRRGTYFDLDADPPGPVVTTTAEVAKCLIEVDTLAEQYAEPLARFRARFNAYETGRAAQAVVAEVFVPRAGRR